MARALCMSVSRARERVAAWLEQPLAAQVAVLCAARDSQPLIETVLAPAQAAAAAAGRAEIAITVEEWTALVCAPTSCAFFDERLAARLETALPCTLSEKGPSERWRKRPVRAACVLALYLEETEALLGAALGGMVRSDSRRLEELVAEVEDEQPDLLHVCDLAAALVAG